MKQKFQKKANGAIVDAEKEGTIWWITHKDGCETRLSDKKFVQRYEKYTPGAVKEEAKDESQAAD